MPSEHALVDEYGVARGAARQVVMLLRNEDLFGAVHGLECLACPWAIATAAGLRPLRSDRLAYELAGH